SRAKRAIAHRDEAAASEQRTGIILGLHVAVGNVDVLAADEVESIVIAVHSIVDVQALHPHILALNDSNRMKCARQQRNVADTQITATVEQEMVGTIRSPAARRRRSPSLRTPKLRALTVDSPLAFNRDVLRVNREQQSDI